MASDSWFSSRKPRKPACDPMSSETLVREANRAAADGEGAVGGGQRERVGAGQLVDAHQVGDRGLLGRRPQQGEDLEHAARRGTGRQTESTNGRVASTMARPMSQATMTFLRSQRSTSTPPTDARKKPGIMRARMTRPMAASGELPPTPVGDRQHRHQADPVAQRRHDLGQPQAEERRTEPRSWAPRDRPLRRPPAPSFSVAGSSPRRSGGLRHGSVRLRRGPTRPG